MKLSKQAYTAEFKERVVKRVKGGQRRGRQAVHQRDRLGNIRRLSFGQDKFEQQSQPIGDRVDLASKAPRDRPRTSLSARLLAAPAAQA
jgi:hypothetical protein